jgi:preprotein translocase subunit SecD
MRAMRWLRGVGLLLLVAAVACGQPTPTRVGLVLDYEASTPEGGTPAVEQMERLKSIVEQRLRVGGPGGVVELGEGGRLVVNTPEVADPDAVRTLVLRSARVEIIPLPPDRYGTTSAPGPLAPPARGETIPGDLEALLTGRDFVSVDRGVEQSAGQPVVEFELSPRGSSLLAEHTRTHVGEFMAITLDREALTVPSINEEIHGGKGIISVAGGSEEVDRLVALMQSGELPLIVRELP